MTHIRIAYKSIIIGLLFFILIRPYAVYGAETREIGKEIPRKTAQEYYRRGLEYDKQNEFKLAIEQYDRAIAVYPEVAAYYLKRGEAFFKNKQIEQSIEDFTKAIEIQPENYEAYFDRARSYVAGNQKDKAIADIKQTVKICTDTNRYNKNQS